MTPSRGYLIRALFEWLCDNDLTPHIAVMAEVPGTEVPQAYVKDGQITLNIAPSAVRDLLMDNEAISFSARFAGQPMQVFVPIAAVAAIFARETGAGMGFGMEPGAELLAAQVASASGTSPQAVEKDESPQEQADKAAETKQSSKPGKSKRPSLRVIK